MAAHVLQSAISYPIKARHDPVIPKGEEEALHSPSGDLRNADHATRRVIRSLFATLAEDQNGGLVTLATPVDQLKRRLTQAPHQVEQSPAVATSCDHAPSDMAVVDRDSANRKTSRPNYLKASKIYMTCFIKKGGVLRTLIGATPPVRLRSC